MRLLLAAWFVAVMGCAVTHTGLGSEPGADSAVPDTTEPDLGSPDAGLPDAPDGATSDVGIPDGGTPDGTPPDSSVDASPPDASPPDASPPDMAVDMAPDVDPCSEGPDSDSDGIADVCDDWPCGPRPTYPLTVTQEQITVSGVQISGMGNTVVLRVGDEFNLVFDWSIEEPRGCRGCTNQVEWGFVPLGRFDCAYDGEPPRSGASGTETTATFTVPAVTPGVYELRFNRGYRDACGDFRTPWWPDAPTASRTVGAVCVAP